MEIRPCLRGISLPVSIYKQCEEFKQQYQLSWRQLCILGMYLVLKNSENPAVFRRMEYVKRMYRSTPGRPRKRVDDGLRAG